MDAIQPTLSRRKRFMLDRLSHLIPLLRWAPRYDRADLRWDLSAGFTTAVMLIPQAMAYALLAGLPPIHGLYAAIAPLIVYAFLGTSRHLAIGPAAMDSLLVATGLVALSVTQTDTIIAYAAILAMMVGVIQVVMGSAKLGFVVNFLSQPVLSGFTSAAAILIAISQLPRLIGVEVARGSSALGTLREVISNWSTISVTTLLLAIASMGALVLLKRWRSSFPRALVVVALATLASALFDLPVATLGEVPAGLPSFNLPDFDTDAITEMAPLAITLALVGYTEAIAVAKALAGPDDERHLDANQELIALGSANIAGAVTQGFPITGGLSRSAVHAGAGARTPLAGLVTAMVVALSLLLLTPLFSSLPYAVLASIIAVAVFGLIDLGTLKRLWRVKRGDFVLLLLTFFATLGLGIQIGLAIGVVTSLGWFVVRSTHPHFAVLGRIPETETYRNISNYPDALRVEGIIIVRMDAQFYFGNVSFLRERLLALMDQEGDAFRAIIIDASSMNQLDSSAARAMEEFTAFVREGGGRLLLANLKWPVRHVLERDGYFERHGYDELFLTVHDAAVAAASEDDTSV